MDKRHSPKVDTEGVHPVMTMAGIMPGGSEMRHWHTRVPFPDPAAIARYLAEGEARTHLELARQADMEADSGRRMELGTCFRPAGNCMYEYACVRCPFLHVDGSALARVQEIEADTEALLAKAETAGWDGEVQALNETLAFIAEKKIRALAAARWTASTGPIN